MHGSTIKSGDCLLCDKLYCYINTLALKYSYIHCLKTVCGSDKEQYHECHNNSRLVDSYSDATGSTQKSVLLLEVRHLYLTCV